MAILVGLLTPNLEVAVGRTVTPRQADPRGIGFRSCPWKNRLTTSPFGRTTLCDPVLAQTDRIGILSHKPRGHHAHHPHALPPPSLVAPHRPPRSRARLARR